MREETTSTLYCQTSVIYCESFGQSHKSPQPRRWPVVSCKSMATVILLFTVLDQIEHQKIKINVHSDSHSLRKQEQNSTGSCF